MNRLIIIGNGFDLAHGLPTGYCDFIGDYWAQTADKLKALFLKEETGQKIYTEGVEYNDSFVHVRLKFLSRTDNSSIRSELEKINDYQSILKFIKAYAKKTVAIMGQHSAAYNRRQDDCVLKFNNKFFHGLCIKRHDLNWVDIENEYYQLLNKCSELKDEKKLRELNEDFEEVKEALSGYLDEKVNSRYDFDFSSDSLAFINIFEVRPLGLAADPNHPYLKEFPSEDGQQLVAEDNSVAQLQNDSVIYGNKVAIGQENLFLNFNYTKTLDGYLDVFNSETEFPVSYQIQIHGRLNTAGNEINFGFGDEMDDRYKIIENHDDNEYLKNFKSFKYLQNSNYKSLLDFIDSGKFQVYIMGHSCGLSDRTLLNTIFEHAHCRSIKVFYHQKESGKDNYTEIIQNISRHFNKKKLMRDKIVNKTLCRALPQIQLPVKNR